MRLHAIEAGAGVPLVVLHGLFGSAQNWGAIQRRLAAAQRVLALDLRNHGASPHAAAMDYSTMAADVIETLTALDALPATLLGHSMGGKVAMQLALSQPELVTRLIVADVAPVAYRHGLEAYVAAMQALPLRPGLTRREADTALAASIPEPAIRGFLLQNLLFAENPPRWRLALPEIGAAMPVISGFPVPVGAQYSGPTLFLAGANSDYVRPSSHATIRALFPAAEIVTIANAGHWLHAEQAAAFIAAVEAFLSPAR